MDAAFEEALSYEAKLTINYFDTFYSGTEYTLLPQKKNMGDLLKSINSHFATFKPTGQMRAPFLLTGHTRVQIPQRCLWMNFIRLAPFCFTTKTMMKHSIGTGSLNQ